MNTPEIMQTVGQGLWQSMGGFAIGFFGLLYYSTRKRSRSKSKRLSNIMSIFLAIAFMLVSIYSALGKDPFKSAEFVFNDWKGITLAIVEIILAVWIIFFVIKRKFK